MTEDVNKIMSTVLRVKRRMEESPHEAFVLHCKRLKTDEKADLSPAVFIFSGTICEKDSTDIQLNKILLNNIKEIQVKEHNAESVLSKMRRERKDTSKEKRFEIVNCSRGLETYTEGTEEKAEDVKNYSVLDLEDKNMKKEQNEEIKYAYDFYLSQKEDFDVSMLDNIVRIDPYANELTYGSYRDNGRVTPSSDEGSEDSNDENNWRNDYPDSDHSEHSIQEEDMMQAMEDCNLENDLSSDSGEEDLVYGDSKTHNVNTEIQPDSEDIERYGLAYAKYKARVLAGMSSLNDKSNLVYCTKPKDIDEESVEGYKDDSDDGFYYGRDDKVADQDEEFSHDEENSEDYDCND